jgi:hypothetical protein
VCIFMCVHVCMCNVCMCNVCVCVCVCVRELSYIHYTRIYYICPQLDTRRTTLFVAKRSIWQKKKYTQSVKLNLHDMYKSIGACLNVRVLSLVSCKPDLKLLGFSRDSFTIEYRYYIFTRLHVVFTLYWLQYIHIIKKRIQIK